MKPSGTVGATKEGKSRRAWARAVGEGPWISLEESGGYRYVTGREAVVDVGSCGKSNVMGTTERSSVVPINN